MNKLTESIIDVEYSLTEPTKEIKQLQYNNELVLRKMKKHFNIAYYFINIFLRFLTLVCTFVCIYLLGTFVEYVLIGEVVSSISNYFLVFEIILSIVLSTFAFNKFIFVDEENEKY